MPVKTLLHLNNNQRLTSLFVDDKTNSVLIGMNDGRIIKAIRSVINAYATGNRVISAKVMDGSGFLTEEAMIKTLYLCRNAILQATNEGEISSSWTATIPYSANKTEEAEGIFTSQPLYAGEDFIFWNDISWNSSGDGANITVKIRTAETESDLFYKNWTSFNSSVIQPIRLDAFSLKEPWIQIRTSLKSSLKNISPSISSVAVSYRTKFAVYFFTTKFVLERGTNLESGLIVANTSVPQNTEIKIGISDKNSAAWNEYQIISTDKAFQIETEDTERVKVGIKFISYSNNSVAVADEFALMLGGQKMEILKA